MFRIVLVGLHAFNSLDRANQLEEEEKIKQVHNIFMFCCRSLEWGQISRYHPNSNTDDWFDENFNFSRLPSQGETEKI